MPAKGLRTIQSHKMKGYGETMLPEDTVAKSKLVIYSHASIWFTQHWWNLAQFPDRFSSMLELVSFQLPFLFLYYSKQFVVTERVGICLKILFRCDFAVPVEEVHPPDNTASQCAPVKARLLKSPYAFFFYITNTTNIPDTSYSL